MIPYELRIRLSRDQLFHALAETALKDPANGFPILADHAEESGMPTLAGILRRHRAGNTPKPDWWHMSDGDYGSMMEDDTDQGQPSGSAHRILSSPELIPGVHIVPSRGGYHVPWEHGTYNAGKQMDFEHGGYHVFDMRGYKHPEGEYYELGRQEDIAAALPKPHYFGSNRDRKDGLDDVHELETK
jgi:hypothetical protein